jgi:hypothetical protein
LRVFLSSQISGNKGVYKKSEKGLHVDNFTSSPHDISVMHLESAPESAECTEPEATCCSCARRLHSLVTAQVNL